MEPSPPGRPPACRLPACLLGLWLLAAPGLSAAQDAPPGPAFAPRPEEARPLEPPPVAVLDMLRTTQPVARLTHDTDGRVHGLLLADGTEVRLGPELASAAERLRPGMAVELTASRPSSAGSWLATRLADGNGRPLLPVGTRRSPLPYFRPIAIAARVARFLVDERGQVDGALLANGVEVAFPVAMGPQVRSAFDAGEALDVLGHGTELDDGTVFVSADRLRAERGRVIGVTPPPWGVAGPRDELAR